MLSAFYAQEMTNTEPEKNQTKRTLCENCRKEKKALHFTWG